MARTIEAVDMFCGAGGTSTGLAQACERLGLKLNLLAINHWRTAIESHAANHPWARHECAEVEKLKPSRVCGRRALDLLVASPECTHHSNARGGKPRDEQSRASAWHVLHWCQELYVKNLIVENVPEFTNWAPLDAAGHPLKSRRGETFQAWLAALKSLGYRYQWRYLTAADYGDATTRRRFFLFATRSRKGLCWPQPSHVVDPGSSLFSAAPWRPASEVIDWSLPGHSIFLTREDVRKYGLRCQRPLKINTLRRIEAGVRKFWGELAEPFIAVMNNLSDPAADSRYVRRLDKPLPVIMAEGKHFGLLQPFMVPFFGERSGQQPRNQSVDGPLATVASHGAGGIIQPFILQCAHGAGKGGHERRAASLGDPLQTVAGNRGTFALLQPFILNQDQRGRDRALGEPLPTVVTSCSHGLVQPFVIKYNRTGGACSIQEPVQTISTDDRFGLVRPMVVESGGQRYLFDILFRMLTVKELAAAHSFPAAYRFAGTKSDQVMQIGNSVPVATAEALAGAMLRSA